MQDADAEHRDAGRQQPIREHEPCTEKKTERAEPERANSLSEAPSPRAEEDQRQREERDADVGDPLAGVEIVEHDRPEGIERADHQEHGRSHHQTGDHRPVA